MMKEKCKNMLNRQIIPFWNSLLDERGGFYGRMNQQLELFKDADKGVILNSRILWFYSASYIATKDESLKAYADHAFDFLKNCCIDNEFGGVYWMMDCNGNPLDTMKHTYNQAFAVYALSVYHQAFESDEAISIAMQLYNTIEEKTFKNGLYEEAFTREWDSADNDALSENGIDAKKTMNSILHLIEAYTELLRSTGDLCVRKSLKNLLDIVEKYVFDEKSNALRVFFDEDMNVLGNIHSYGHDIEASWLIDRACEVLCEDEYTEKFKKIDLAIANNILDVAFENGALNNERDGAEISKKRVWWVQAETVVGFLNAYQSSGDEKFLNAAQATLDYIEKYVVDQRCGEWFPDVSFEGKPFGDFDMVGPWKCPYQNGRMCIEVLKRL